MAVPMQCHISGKENDRDETTPLYTQKWYFTRKEIECHTPSRSDGIDYKNEQHLRKLYCSFLQELGIELKVPQVTIATAMMFCHRFYMRQSHAKNDWQTIATVCMFLAGKAKETPRWLGELVVVAYKLIYKWDPSAPRRIREIYDKQKELIVVGETLLLTTLAFDMNIEHPYESLVATLKRLDITNKELVKVAWNFVNDWLRTSLCLQHKPHYIAAGSLFLAAKVMKVKLPTAKGKAWWMEFDVSPKQLEDVIQQMMSLLEQSQSLTPAPVDQNMTESVDKKIATCSAPNGSRIVPDSKIIASKDACEPTKSTPFSSLKQHTSEKVDATSREPPNFQMSDTREPPNCQKSDTREPPNCQTNDNREPSNRQKSDTREPPNCQTSDTGEPPKRQMSDTREPPNCQMSGTRDPPNCQTSDTGSGVSVVEDGESGEPVTVKSDSISSCKIVSVRGIVGNSQVDVDRIREKLKKRSFIKAFKKTRVEEDMDGDIDGEAWIERELENGIVLKHSQPEKERNI